MINWQLGAAHFGALWYETGLDRYPFPFDIASGFEWQVDAERYEREVRAAFAGPEHERLHAAVRVLAHPDVHVAVTGRTVDGVRIRVIAAQADRFAAIAVQRPGTDDAHGGDVVLGFGSVDRLAGAIIGVLPQNAGGHKEFQRSSAESSSGSLGFLTSASATRPAPRLEQELAAGHAGHGAVRVWAGPRYGRQLEVGRLRWIDIAGDGRYLIGPGDRDRARPGGPDRLTTALGKLVQIGLDDTRDNTHENWQGQLR